MDWDAAFKARPDLYPPGYDEAVAKAMAGQEEKRALLRQQAQTKRDKPPPKQQKKRKR